MGNEEGGGGEEAGEGGGLLGLMGCRLSGWLTHQGAAATSSLLSPRFFDPSPCLPPLAAAPQTKTPADVSLGSLSPPPCCCPPRRGTHQLPSLPSSPPLPPLDEDPTNVGIYAIAFFVTTLGIIYVQVEGGREGERRERTWGREGGGMGGGRGNRGVGQLG